MEPISDNMLMGTTLKPHLKGCYFFCKGTKKNARLGQMAMENSSVIRINDDCCKLCNHGRQSETGTRVSIFICLCIIILLEVVLLIKRISYSPGDLVAMTHNPAFERCDETSLGMIPETKPLVWSIIPYICSVELAEA